MKKFISGIVAFVKKNYVFILLSAFCMILFSGKIADIVYSHVKYEEITFRTYSIEWEGNSTVKIIDNEYWNDKDIGGDYYYKYRSPSWDSIVESVQSNTGFTLVKGDRDFEGFSYYETDQEGANISFKVPVYPTTSFTVLVGDNKLGVAIENSAGERIREIGIGDNICPTEKCLCCAVFSSKDYAYIFLQYFLIYAFVFVGLLIILIISWKLLLYIIYNSNFLLKLSPLSLFCIIAGFQFFYVSVRYFVNPEVYEVSEMADAYYYMHPMVRNAEGQISIKTFVDGLYTFRGYIPNAIAAIFNSLSARSGINIMLFYFMLFALINAFTFAVACPLLYEALTDKKAKNISILFSYILFFAFWERFLYFYLSDIPGAMFTVCAVAFGVYGIKRNEKEWWYFFLSGLFIGAAGGYRSAYSIVAYGLLGVVFIVQVVNCKRNGPDKSNIKKVFLSTLAVGSGMVLILLPQFAINLYKGHIGLFPFDSVWWPDEHTNSVVTLTESSFTDGLHRYAFGASDSGDKQLWLIDSMFCRDRYYSMNEILYLLLTHPLEFVSGYCKKLFWAMSAAGETVYTPGLSVFAGNILIVLNYLLLGTMGHNLIKGKNDIFASKEIQILFILSAVLTICPQAVLHIERRYFLFYFLLIYFYNGFVVLNGLIEEKNKDKFFDTRYLVSIMIFIVLAFAARMTISYSFC